MAAGAPMKVGAWWIRARNAALASSLVLAAACVGTQPMRPRAERVVAAPTIQLTNFMTGPGTWQYKVQHINPPYYWYLISYYSNGDTVVTPVAQGASGSLEALDMLQSVRIDVLWCYKPIGSTQN